MSDYGLPSPSDRLHPVDRLRSHQDYDRVYNGGKKCPGSLILVHAFYRNDILPPRLGLTVSKRCGGACVRNRIRRRLREIARIERAILLPGWDIVLTARPTAADATYDGLRRQFRRGLSSLGVALNHA